MAEHFCDQPALVRIIDDDTAVRESLGTVLEVEGLTVKTWSDPLAYLREDAPSIPGCLLLDVMMPGMSGIEVQRELVRRAAQIPVIFISAFGDVDRVVQTMKFGAYDFLAKPIDPVRLVATVRQAVASRTLRDSPATIMQHFQMLTDREKEIVRCAYQGLSNTGIAEELKISRRTVEAHRAAAYQKLGINDIAGLRAVMALLEDLERA